MTKFLKQLTSFFLFGLLLISCQEEMTTDSEFSTQKEMFKSTVGKLSPPEIKIQIPENLISKDFPLKSIEEVEASECDTTPFDDVINESVSSNIDALGFGWYNVYAEMNFLYTITDDSKQYFGDKGQYTNYVNNRVRSLEKFWNMPNEVTVRGQHNSTLDNKQKIIDIFTFWYTFDPEEPTPEEYADYFVDYVNVQSTFLVETPLLSFDGFAISLGGFLGQGDLIVIGDGLVELASKAGVEDKIVWSGILAHEWAHQIQFNKNGSWYPIDPITRTTELEADYFTAFYLTHKRGGTYNWKRVQDFLELFYNIGDCYFEDDSHHGTPLQRMRAAEMGYELAQSAKVNGKVMSDDEVHEYFLSSLDEIIAGE